MKATFLFFYICIIIIIIFKDYEFLVILVKISPRDWRTYSFFKQWNTLCSKGEWSDWIKACKDLKTYSSKENTIWRKISLVCLEA